MGLTNALQIGKSGILASQSALQAVGNNLANVGTEGYHRSKVSLSPVGDQEILNGIFVGRGVQLQSITRLVDEALETRLRGSVANQSGSLERQELLEQVESVHNELSEISITSRLTDFFASWSSLAANPGSTSEPSTALRSDVVNEGQIAADHLRQIRLELTAQREQVDLAIIDSVNAVDSLLTQVEQINESIALQESGRGQGASALRDQRDVLLTELATYLDISTNELGNGEVDVFVGSTPLVLNGDSRGLTLENGIGQSAADVHVVIKDDGQRVNATTGKLGAQITFRQEDWQEAVDTLDNLARELIFEVNKLHSTGQGLVGSSSVTGANKVLDADASLNDPAAGLDFTPVHGSFQIHVEQNGVTTTQQINIDLDGLNGNDTTLNTLIAQINDPASRLAGMISASATADGRLQITAGSDSATISFSDDSSGVLATLGVNSYFTGSSAADIGVNQALQDDPRLIAAGRQHSLSDPLGANENALSIAELGSTPIEALNGRSLSDFWTDHVADYASRLSATGQQAEADTLVRQSLEAQRQELSGVNVDEETIDLIQYQRSFQASARFISVTDELIQTLLGLV
ncbi:flagellar hook-associated protein FlgK [Mucisphaera calidilacus]|uniref:Flagellar hook-associated protein 1 n=1 Tax=Mucisphaera calidilacus TaxID=2527982 RepID=A0A518BZF8_9BACT|nr:flagellar hook-associated protein FlgK [Mucisphaera calidilacus]QDU72362.1 Flagellar hook-associated protein 1 [Mucisphaera calidilacus]